MKSFEAFKIVRMEPSLGLFRDVEKDVLLDMTEDAEQDVITFLCILQNTHVNAKASFCNIPENNNLYCNSTTDEKYTFKLGHNGVRALS
jgi:hypothetical protein